MNHTSKNLFGSGSFGGFDITSKRSKRPPKPILRRQFTKTTVSGDRLRYEAGTFSKSTRTIQLSKLQDVRVDQNLMQRMFGVGDLSLETSGETSRLTIENVDSPQNVADELLNRSQHGTAV